MRKSFFSAVALGALLASSAGVVRGATIIDNWTAVKVPPPPPVSAVTVDPATTALLVLDFVTRICAFPECTAAVPNVAKLIAGARASHTAVIYSGGNGMTPSDVLPALAPQSGDPMVQSHADKFIGTNLEQLLTQRGIKTVIVSGVAGNGAALYTASHAAFLGLKVVVPIDTIPANSSFGELLTVWQLPNAPGVGSAVTLTTAAQVTF